MKSVIILAVFVAIVNADLYMHNPRGSNDRLNEEGTNRDNGNRLFDSQNNAKGGYCVGPAMSYYAGSLLNIEWTNQHGCGNNPKLRCNMVFQYTCGSNKETDGLKAIRDGTTTTTIPDDPSSNTNGAAGTDANGNFLYGMHESYDSYQACKTRERNMGLWISDREQQGGLNEGRRDARFTRQNNNGDRNGFECTEERDYYPYWHPTIWKDIAILAMDEDHCTFYQKESQNVKPKNWCANKDGTPSQANNNGSCAQTGGERREEPSWGLPAPTCIMSDWSRDNHLGNGMGGYPNMFNWTVPTKEKCIEDNSCNCVLRIRYNISSADLEAPTANGNSPSAGFLDWTYNANNSPVKDDQLAEASNFTHQLALDTTQFGRTFQDRSHVFHIRPRPDGVSPVARIFNLNVRGKRGNIVQAYPAVEYDFVPEALYVRRFDYIHFQWTGCDTNPQGNAGEGTDQTDRNNIVQIANIGDNKPATDDWLNKNGNKPLFQSEELRYYMASLGQTNCLTYEELKAKHPNDNNAQETDTQNCMKLNSAPTGYFDGGLIRMNVTGTYYYMSSRNNNFTNRGQKGSIMVEELLPVWAIVLVVVGAFVFTISCGLGAAMLYARSHPHSSVANLVSRF